METTFVTSNGIACQVGCVVDGSRGIYAIPCMVREAVALGFVLSADDDALVTAYESDAYSDMFDAMVDIADAAEDYLNSITPDEYVWHWSDGDFRVDHVSELVDV